MEALEKLIENVDLDLDTLNDKERNTIIKVLGKNVEVDDITIIQFIDIANAFNLTLDELYSKLKSYE